MADAVSRGEALFCRSVPSPGLAVRECRWCVLALFCSAGAYRRPAPLSCCRFASGCSRLAGLALGSPSGIVSIAASSGRGFPQGLVYSPSRSLRFSRPCRIEACAASERGKAALRRFLLFFRRLGGSLRHLDFELFDFDLPLLQTLRAPESDHGQGGENRNHIRLGQLPVVPLKLKFKT